MARSLYPSDAEVGKIIVGPDSVAWGRISDFRLQLAMLYPLLLQVAHPTVAAGVRDHSDFERRPWDRLWATIDYVSVLVYGGRDAAPAGRRLRELHRGFKGTREDGRPYRALEPHVYAWVHATLLETYVAGHARFGRPMRRDEVERFYGEYRRLGRLIGVRDRDLPDTWADFRAYFEKMLRSALWRTESFERVLETIGRAPAPPGLVPGLAWQALRIPAARAMWLGGIGLMTPSLRRRLGVSWSWRDEAQLRALAAFSRALDPVMPERLRVTGPAHLRWRAREIAEGPLAVRTAQ